MVSTDIPASKGADVTPGVLPAWAVSFREDGRRPGKALLTVGSDSYDGTVTATLPRDLAGGTYQVVVEGLTDEDYAEIRLTPGRRLAASLHLWWKDAPSGILGDLARVTGLADPLGAITPEPPEGSLVADLRVDTLRRRAGERRYELVMSGRERAVALLSERRVYGACYVSLDAAVKEVAGQAGVDVVRHGLDQAKPTKDQPDFANTSPGTALAAMTTLAEQARNAIRLFGPPVAVIRDGTLHLGKWSEPAAGAGRLGAARGLNERSGLVSIERGPDQQRDAAAGDPPPGAPKSRGTITVTALGRPDLKPGDTLSLVLPPEDFPVLERSSIGGALLTSLTGLLRDGTDPATKPSTCLVTEVSHRLSRRQGFVTTVQAVVLAAGDDGWDPPAPAAERAPARADQPRGAAASDSASAAAKAVQTVLRDVLGGEGDLRGSRVAMVHDHAASGVPRHTSDVWYADVAPDGFPAAAQRTVVTEANHGELRQVPYVTPFGWGHYGLVLPRYPGTRVLLVDAGGGHGDLVDAGAVWPRDAGPPAAAGDWWLVLPVGIQQREHLPRGGGDAPDGPASHDLIDGDGTRVIETARFVVRVTDKLTDCTARPAPGPDAPVGSVLIETKQSSGKGASIRLRDDGSVTITGTKITLDAGTGDISINAHKVAVKVADTMDVS